MIILSVIDSESFLIIKLYELICWSIFVFLQFLTS